MICFSVCFFFTFWPQTHYERDLGYVGGRGHLVLILSLMSVQLSPSTFNAVNMASS